MIHSYVIIVAVCSHIFVFVHWINISNWQELSKLEVLKHSILSHRMFYITSPDNLLPLHCFDTVGWATGRHLACKTSGDSLLVVTIFD